MSDLPNNFFIDDVMRFITMAGNSLYQDEFGKCFQPQPRRKYPLFSMMWPFWLISIIIRYFVIFPLRILLFVLLSGFALSVLVPLAWLNPHGGSPLLDVLLHVYMQGILMSLGLFVKYEGKKPNLRSPHIFVANHTSVTDFAVASGQGRFHAVVAQAHGGVFGWLSRAVLKPLTDSLLFDRNESRDRAFVGKRMRQHVADPKSNPLLIFPEGTCVNNEYTVLFHKGAFELDCLVCPIAIKYDKIYGDPYFNTREQSFLQHLFYLMTRWCSFVRVRWLPPCKRKEGESSVQFSERVKAMISEAAGLQNLSWDGYLKNYRPTREKQDKMRLETRQEYLKELFKKIGQEYEQFSSDEGEDRCESPELPEKDYEDEKDKIEDEKDKSEDEKDKSEDEKDKSEDFNFDQRLSRSRESLGKKICQLREALSPKQPTSSSI